MIQPNGFDDDDDDIFDFTDSSAYSPISSINASSIIIPPLPPPPTKSHHELINLSDELMSFLQTTGLQVGTTEFFLLKAAYYGYTEIALIAIFAGANINARQPTGHPHAGKTALSIAQAERHQSIVTVIEQATMSSGPPINIDPLQAQFDLNFLLVKFVSGLHDSSALSQNEKSYLIELMELIITWENNDCPVEWIPQLRQDIATHLAQSTGIVSQSIFSFAHESDSYPLWEVCIQAGMPFKNADNKWKKTPLHRAAELDRVDLATLFLMNGADANSQEAPHQDTPLMLSIRAGHPHMTAVLLEKGAKLHLKNDLKQSAATMDPISGFVSHVVAPQLFSRHHSRERSHVKAQVRNEYMPRLTIRTMIRELLEYQEERLALWKTWRHSDDGRASLKDLHLQFLDLLSNAPADKQREMFKIATDNGYTEISDV